MEMVTEGVSQPLSEKVINELLLTLNKKYTRVSVSLLISASLTGASLVLAPVSVL